MPYRFRNNPARGRRYSLWAYFTTDLGRRPVLEWFDTAEDLMIAAGEMQADGRFSGLTSYCRSQEHAGAPTGLCY